MVEPARVRRTAMNGPTLAAVLVAMLLAMSGTARAQTRGAEPDASAYPARSVRIIAANPPGGASDFVGRLVAQKLGEALGQPFVFDNRPGASGIIATMAVVKAPA